VYSVMLRDWSRRAVCCAFVQASYKGCLVDSRKQVELGKRSQRKSDPGSNNSFIVTELPSPQSRSCYGDQSSLWEEGLSKEGACCQKSVSVKGSPGLSIVGG
jgi:hypothetical protein